MIRYLLMLIVLNVTRSTFTNLAFAKSAKLPLTTNISIKAICQKCTLKKDLMSCVQFVVKNILDQQVSGSILRVFMRGKNHMHAHFVKPPLLKKGD